MILNPCPSLFFALLIAPAAVCAEPTHDCMGSSCTMDLPLPYRWGGGTPDGVPDVQQCAGDWDRDHYVTISDVAGYVGVWFFHAQNPGAPECLQADLDCDGAVTPSDIATFVAYWLADLSAHGTVCP